MNRYERQAAYAIVRVANEVPTGDVMVTVMAAVVMLQMEPEAFKSDTAFWVQVAIRFRCLTDTSFGSYWNQREGRAIKLHREIPQKVLLSIGKWLVDALGMGGVHVARAEKERQEKEQNKHAQFHEALRSLA